jgi:PAS domain S-box-containing protein
MSKKSAPKGENLNNEPKPHRQSVTWLLGGMVLVLLTVLVALQAFGLWSGLPDTASDTLLLYALSSLNFVAFVLFSFIFIRSLLKLRRERREKQLGSKIKTRLVAHFIAVSLLPIAAMAVFSYLFVNRSIEKWFYKLPDETLREVGRVQGEASYLENRNLHEISAILTVVLNNPQVSVDESLLNDLVQRGGLAAIEIVSPDGEPLLQSLNPSKSYERVDLQSTIDLARQTQGSADSLTDGKDFDAIVSPLGDGRSLIIVSSRRTESNIDTVITGYRTEYQKLVARQRRVRLLGLSTLGLLTLLLIFAATWIAIHLARGIAGPIQALAEASKEVARGNLSYRVSTLAEDELALLADSFNQMTSELEENRRRIEAGAAELREKNLALEDRRNYIETVLESLTTGVISLEANETVTTINAAAASMLHLEAGMCGGARLSEVTCAEDNAVLERLVRRARRIGRSSEQTELFRTKAGDVEPIPVALTATALKPGAGRDSSVVIVMEDMTELLAAQRAAAWSEVARRMAHEIKNPLTPIQLSAERIAKNFRKISEEPGRTNGEVPVSAAERARVASVVDECTTTITREVAGLKAMVDEFSRFARLPHARLEPADLNEVIKQAVALYQDRLNGIRLDVRLARTLPTVLLDSEQMRRVFVNLIDNALEALDAAEGEPRVTIATGRDPSRGLVLVEVTDTGHGIEKGNLGRLFQPYFSTRGRGTGLGLAIVQRIVSDHGGRIRAEANRPTGAKFTLEMPEYAVPERS